MNVSRLYLGLFLGFSLGITGVGGIALPKVEVFANELASEDSTSQIYEVEPHSLVGVYQAINLCNSKSGFVSTIKNQRKNEQIISTVSCIFVKNQPIESNLVKT